MPTAPETPRRRAYSTVFLTVLLDLVGFGMILPILPYYALEFDVPPARIGLLFSAYSLAQLVCAPLVGRLSDRLGRRPVLLASIAGNVGAYLLFAAAGDFLTLLLARTLSGVTASYGVAQAYVADVTEGAERSRAMGMVGAAFGLGFVLGPALGGVLAPLGATAVPLAAAGLAAVNLLSAFLWLPESLPREMRGAGRGGPWLSPTGLGRLAADRPLAGILALFFLVIFCFSLMEVTLPLFCNATFGFSRAQTSWLFAYIGVVLVAVQGGLVGRLVKRFGERRLILAGIALMALGLLALPWTPTASLLTVTTALLAIGSAIHNPSIMGLLSRLTDRRAQGGTIGLSRSLSALARTLGPATGTWIFGAFGAAWPFWTAGALMGGSLLVAWAVLRRVPVG